MRPVVWHKWRHPSCTLVSLWSNGRKRLARSLVGDGILCVCVHNDGFKPNRGDGINIQFPVLKICLDSFAFSGNLMNINDVTVETVGRVIFVACNVF